MKHWITLLAAAIPAVTHALPQGVLIARETRAAVRVVSGGDSSFFVRGVVRDLKPLRGGGIAMLAPRALHIFDASGRPFTVIAGIANGMSFEVDPSDSTVTVRDAGTRQWKTFDLRGKLLSHMPIEQDRSEVTWNMRGGPTLTETSPVLVRTDEPASTDASFRRTVSIRTASDSLTRLFEFRVDSVFFKAGYDTVDARSRTLPSNRVFVPVPTRFGATGAWALDGDSGAVFADGRSGEVTWYSIGAKGAVVSGRGSVGRTSRAVSHEDVEAETARLQRLAVVASPSTYKNPKNVSSPTLMGPPPVWSVATRAFFADNGDLWVGVNRVYTEVDPSGQQVFRIGDDNTWTVFPRKGAAFVVTLPPLFRLTTIRSGRLYGYVDTPTGVTAEVYAVGGVVK